MCGRFTQHHSPKQLKDRFQIQQMRFEFGPRYNVAPTQNIAVVTVNRNGERARPRRLSLGVGATVGERYSDWLEYK